MKKIVGKIHCGKKMVGKIPCGKKMVGKIHCENKIVCKIHMASAWQRSVGSWGDNGSMLEEEVSLRKTIRTSHHTYIHRPTQIEEKNSECQMTVQFE